MTLLHLILEKHDSHTLCRPKMRHFFISTPLCAAAQIFFLNKTKKI